MVKSVEFLFFFQIFIDRFGAYRLVIPRVNRYIAIFETGALSYWFYNDASFFCSFQRYFSIVSHFFFYIVKKYNVFCFFFFHVGTPNGHCSRSDRHYNTIIISISPTIIRTGIRYAFA